MAASRKLLESVLSGQRDRNMRFSELRKLVQNMGFEERIKGDHHIFTRNDVAEILNLQPRRDGSAKPLSGETGSRDHRKISLGA